MSPTHTHTHTRTDRPTNRDASHLKTNEKDLKIPNLQPTD